jgi:hypothetical protein
MYMSFEKFNSGIKAFIRQLGLLIVVLIVIGVNYKLILCVNLFFPKLFSLSCFFLNNAVPVRPGWIFQIWSKSYTKKGLWWLCTINSNANTTDVLGRCLMHQDRSPLAKEIAGMTASPATTTLACLSCLALKESTIHIARGQPFALCQTQRQPLLPLLRWPPARGQSLTLKVAQRGGSPSCCSKPNSVV